MRAMMLVGLLVLAGCASGPGLGRVGSVVVETARPAGREYVIRGRDCSAIAFGSRVREMSVEQALRNALEENGLPATTPVYSVEAHERGGFPEVCLEARGVVVVAGR